MKEKSPTHENQFGVHTRWYERAQKMVVRLDSRKLQIKAKVRIGRDMTFSGNSDAAIEECVDFLLDVCGSVSQDEVIAIWQLFQRVKAICV
jgi:hypothetical protein